MGKLINHAGSAFIRAVVRRMKQLGLNQSEVARRMNVSRAYISKALQGDVNFSFSTACRFARALEMDFLPGLNSPPSPPPPPTLSTSSLDLSPSTSSLDLSPSTSSLDLSPPTSSLHADNTIYLMHLVSRAYAHAHSLSRQEFNARDAQFNILRYVATCPSVFDALPEAEMVKEVDRYVSRRAVADRLIRKFERVDWRDFQ